MADGLSVAVATTPLLDPVIQSSLINRLSQATVGSLVAVCRYVLFMQTTQRLTRVRRLPAFRVSDWGFLKGPKAKEIYLYSNVQTQSIQSALQRHKYT